MRSGFLAALTALIIGHGSTFAQEFGSFLSDDGDGSAESCRFRGSSEALLWWCKNGRVPPLVTAGGDGKPGSSGTRIQLNKLDFVDDFRPGGQFALSYRLESIPWLLVESRYFFLSNQQSNARFSS